MEFKWRKHKGVLKLIDGGKCFEYWVDNHGDDFQLYEVNHMMGSNVSEVKFIGYFDTENLAKEVGEKIACGVFLS